MKIFYALFTLLFLFSLNSCTGVKTVSVGLENESFISFYSSESSIKNVEVSLVKNGKKTLFTAKVNKMKRNSTNFEKRASGKVYSISTGSHELRVSNNDNIIYSKKIFIGNQETKIIKL